MKLQEQNSHFPQEYSASKLEVNDVMRMERSDYMPDPIARTTTRNAVDNHPGNSNYIWAKYVTGINW